MMKKQSETFEIKIQAKRFTVDGTPTCGIDFSTYGQYCQFVGVKLGAKYYCLFNGQIQLKETDTYFLVPHAACPCWSVK